MIAEYKLEGPYTGSKWVKVDAANRAECPHCGRVSWYSGEKWGGGCFHVVGPGSEDGKRAMIFKGEK